MREGYWAIKTYVSGAVGEKIKFWVPGKKSKRSGKAIETALKKQIQNETLTKRAAARVLNANFKKGDILFGLDYSEDGLGKLIAKIEGFESLDEENRQIAVYNAAEHEMKLFLRRVKRECDKKDIEFKYGVAVTSDMDGKTGELVRVHHHMVINKEALEIAQAKWVLGGVDYKPLSGQPDYTPIAEYLIEQVRRIRDAKKYVSSRNLVRPMPQNSYGRNESMVGVPRGCTVLYRSVFKCGRPQYVRYLLPNPDEEKRGEAIRE